MEPHSHVGGETTTGGCGLIALPPGQTLIDAETATLAGLVFARTRMEDLIP